MSLDSRLTQSANSSSRSLVGSALAGAATYVALAPDAHAQFNVGFNLVNNTGTSFNYSISNNSSVGGSAYSMGQFTLNNFYGFNNNYSFGTGGWSLLGTPTSNNGYYNLTFTQTLGSSVYLQPGNSLDLNIGSTGSTALQTQTATALSQSVGSSSFSYAAPSAVPEASHYGLGMGLMIAGLAAYRRFFGKSKKI